MPFVPIPSPLPDDAALDKEEEEEKIKSVCQQRNNVVGDDAKKA